MKKFLTTSAVLVLGCVTASAADLASQPFIKAPAYVEPVFNWTGFYLGGHIGHLWGRTHVVEDGVVTEDAAPTNGVIGGALAGYNWQIGALVLGLEADIGFADAHGRGISNPTPPIVITTPNAYDVRWTSHVVGRLGYAAGSWLLFATGGLAIADFKFTQGSTTVIDPPSVSGATYTGFSVGAGVETALTRNLLARVQYIYDDFGHKYYTGSDGDPYRVSLTSHTVRGALSWKF